MPSTDPTTRAVTLYTRTVCATFQSYQTARLVARLSIKPTANTIRSRRRPAGPAWVVNHAKSPTFLSAVRAREQITGSPVT